MVERKGLGKVIRRHETVLGGIAGVLEGECRTATRAYSEQIDIGIELVPDPGEVAGGYLDDGVVGAEVGERGDHEDAMGCLLGLCAVCAEEGDGLVPGGG